MEFVRTIEDVDVVVCVGGMALALPGVVDAWAHHFGKSVRVCGVALGEPGSESLLAAQLSISEIPGQPVVTDELAGGVYTGSQGLHSLLDRIRDGELPPEKPRVNKPALIATGKLACFT